jgi:short-subunit dehydrogenase
MKQRMSRVSGLSAVVTGASSGIGRSLALRLGRAGARVGLVARRRAQLEEVEAQIRAEGGESIVVPCDVADPPAVAAAAAEISDRNGAVDLLIHSAGIGERVRFLDSTPEAFERILGVNTLGTVHVTRAFLPAMVERGSGAIVFMASVAGRVATPNETAYVASKFAMVGFAESLSLEVEDAGVHVLVVCPGIVDTPFFGASGPPNIAAPFTSPIDPDDLAEAVIAALVRGDRRLTLPRAIAASYVAQAIAPEWTRRQVKQRGRGTD